MKIILENTGKKYIHSWIFRNINLELAAPGHYGVLGANGSGKTTLLKTLSGFLPASEGTIHWHLQQKDVSENIFRYVSWASPHLELIEEFTFEEVLLFHQKFKPWVGNHSPSSLIELSGLKYNRSKALKYYSSGMKQRVKLLLAVMSNNPLVILDEPCSNLDAASIEWYRKLLEAHMGDRLLLIGSNDKETECFSCNNFIDISDFKPGA